MKKALVSLLFAFCVFGFSFSFADLGDSNTEPAKSCLHIKQERPSVGDGIYWLQNGTMAASKQYYCDMTHAGGGWQLLFQRRGGHNNIESRGTDLNNFLHTSGGNIAAIGYSYSYNSDSAYNNYVNFSPSSYMNIQYKNNMIPDLDDAYILYTKKNIFPDSTGTVENIKIKEVCSLDGSNCDNTDVYWKYVGDSFFSSARCQNGYAPRTAYTPPLEGMYGYCNNGLINAPVNNLIGNRNQYNEAKLRRWWGGVSRDHMERFYIRPNVPEFDSITISSDNTNPSYAKAGDNIRISLKLKEADTWKSSNTLTFSIGPISGLQTSPYTGSSTDKLSGDSIYTILSGQNGTFSFTDLTFKNTEEINSTGFVSPYIPANTIVVDTIPPVISFVDDVSDLLTGSDSIQITVTDINSDATTFKYGFSDDAVCTSGDTYTNTFTGGVTFILTDPNNNGKYICAKAEDKAGNVTYKASINALKIGQKTAAPLVAPQLKNDSGFSGSDAITNINMPILTGACFSGAEVKLYQSGIATSYTGTCLSNNTFEIAIPIALSDGIYNFSYTQNKPEAGYFESDESPSFEMTVDTKNPTDLVVHIDIDGIYTVDKPKIVFSGQDADSGIRKYEIQIDNGTIETFTGGNLIYTPDLNPSSGHTVVVTVYDKAGNITAKTIKYPPIVNILPQETISNTVITGTTINVSGPNPIRQIELTGVNYSNLSCSPSFPSTITGVISCSVNINSSGILTVKGTDNVGAVGSSTQKYIIDNQFPVITFTDDVYLGPVISDTVNIKVIDTIQTGGTHTGLYLVPSSYQYIFIGSGDACDSSRDFGSGAIGYISEANIVFNDETHNGKYICAKAQDKAKNISYQISTHPLRIDATPPTAVISYSTTGWTNQNVTVTMTTNEPIQPLTGRTKIDDTHYSKIVSVNETQTIIIKDIVGNEEQVQYSVQKIDKVNPDCTSGTWSYSPITATSGNVIATLTGVTDRLSQINISGGSCILSDNATKCRVGVSDKAGNEVLCWSDQVTNIDKNSPTITLNGNATQTLMQGAVYTEQGAMCTDNYDTTCTIVTVGSVNTSLPGVYTISYTATDQAGNTATTTRTVTIQKKSRSSGGGGGTLHKDNCPDGDYSPSYYDNTCGESQQEDENTENDDEENLEKDQENRVKEERYMQDLIHVNTSIFNPDFEEHQCHALLDEQTIYQDNEVSKGFMIAHQMLYSYQQTMWRGTKDFAPERKLTREEAAKFMVEFAKRVLCRTPNYEYTNQFVDIGDADPTLLPYIKQSYEYKIFHGDGGGASQGIPTTFRPKDVISYDELVAVMIRLVRNDYSESIESDWAEKYKEYITPRIQSSTISDNHRGNIAQVIYDLYKQNHYTWEEIGFVIVD